jgi:hypothetical protein
VGDTWRDRARPIIAEVIRCFSKGDDPAYVKKAVMATCPWGGRAMWPYAVWCDEAKRQLRAFQGLPPTVPKRPYVDPSDPRQAVLL